MFPWRRAWSLLLVVVGGGDDCAAMFPRSHLSNFIVGLASVGGGVRFPRCLVRLVGWWGGAGAVGVLQEFTFSSLFKPAPL